MELIYDILAIILYILLLSFILIKIRNINLIKKINYKEDYKKIKKEIKQQKISKKSLN